jgi:hypothetical protein
MEGRNPPRCTHEPEDSPFLPARVLIRALFLVVLVLATAIHSFIDNA